MQGTSSRLLNWQQQGWESRDEGIGCKGIGCKGSRAYVSGRKPGLRCGGVGRCARTLAVSKFRAIAQGLE